MTCQAVANHMSNLEEANCRDVESGKQSLSAGAAVPGIRARVAPGCNLDQPAEVMGPAIGMAGALLAIGEAAVGQARTQLPGPMSASKRPSAVWLNPSLAKLRSTGSK